MSIVTLTAAPALDYFQEVTALKRASFQRARSSRLTAAGKGLNVGRYLTELGKEVLHTGFLPEGGKDLFLANGGPGSFRHRFIPVDGMIRINTKIVESSGEVTECNAAMPAPSETSRQDLLDSLRTESARSSFFIFSGNLPSGMPSDFYLKCMESVRRTNPDAHIFLDCGGPALKETIKAGVRLYAVKPNEDEIKDLWPGYSSEEALSRTAEEIRERFLGTLRVFILSLGARGALFVSSDKTVLLSSRIRRRPRSIVGAGDALLAGLVFGLTEGLSEETVWKTAVSLASLKVEIPGLSLAGLSPERLLQENENLIAERIR